MDGIDWRDCMIEDTRGYPGRLSIDCAALRRNYRKLVALAAPAQVAAVVKANAYGLGAEQVSGVLLEAGCRDFFVAQYAEAVALRRVLPEQARLYVLNGLLPGAEAGCAALGIVPVLNSLPQFERWAAEARRAGRRLPAILQFDTGMSRLGMAPAERGRAREMLDAGEIRALYVMSHLASADTPEAGQNAAQLAEMRKVAAEFADVPVSFGNSGGTLMGPAFRGALVRPGFALYGGAPQAGRPNPMQPVVRLHVAVVQTRQVPAGTRIGYGATYVAETPLRLATLAAGYADGLLRSLSGSGAVYFQGIRLPILGRVSMDSMTVDISALPADALGLGSLVEVIGPHQSIDQLAADAGTIGYEILTSLGSRYLREYVQ